MVITKLKVTNFQGIESLSLDVPPAGGVFEGRNGSGKSSAIGAIEAALIASGIKPENVRAGKNRAEILVDLGDTMVRRVIRAAGGSDIAVVPDGGAGGGAARLRELLRAGTLDPLSVFLAKPDKREQMILEAIPIAVTWADVERWLGPDAETVRGWAGFSLDIGRPGPAVLKDIHDRFYALRTASKKVSAAARQEADDAGVRVLEAMAKEDGSLVERADLGTVAAAETLRQAARDAAGDAAAKLRRVQESIATRGAVEANAAKYREDIAAEEAKIDLGATEEKLAAEMATLDLRQRDIADMEALIAKLRSDAADQKAVCDTIRRGIEQNRAKAVLIDAMTSVLATTEAALATGPTSTEVAEDAQSRAAAELETATWYLEQVRLRDDRKKLEAVQDTAREKAQQLAARVDRLEEVMKALNDQAPADLGARGGIPGFDFAAMTLDGVPITTMNTAALMAFSVQLAKRIQGTQVKVLVADGLERLDEAGFAAFVKLACADGWQMIGSRVTNGETLTFHAIEG